MGCFSLTCSLSGLPIDYPDEIVLIPITRKSYPSKFGSEWTPIGLPIYGNYDDYGRIENVSNSWAGELFAKSINRFIVEKDWGENQVHDVPVKRGMGFEDLYLSIIKNRLEADVGTKTAPIEVSMIRKDVWDIYQELGDGDWVAKEINTLETVLDCDDLISNIASLFSIGYREAFMSPDLLFRNTYAKGFEEFIPHRDEVKKEIVNLASVSNYMFSCRKSWIPSWSDGPQHGGWVDIGVMYSKVLEIIKKKVLELHEEEDY